MIRCLLAASVTPCTQTRLYFSSVRNSLYTDPDIPVEVFQPLRFFFQSPFLQALECILHCLGNRVALGESVVLEECIENGLGD